LRRYRKGLAAIRGPSASETTFAGQAIRLRDGRDEPAKADSLAVAVAALMALSFHRVLAMPMAIPAP
jgi:hypothetical protein